ncbi:MAG: hypothetical protein LBT79_06640 [Elusimicrobiota bacterium]|jgi:phosphoribosylanthranilate isomerase|nr:hypothetical protein [Elusimicrobiota bacterium]
MPKIKICGLTNYNDALDAVNLGADFLGFHFIKDSPKKVSEKLGAEIILKLPPFVLPVGVFADEDRQTIAKIVKKSSLKYIQFNGSKSPQECSQIRTELGVKVLKLFNLKKDFVSYDDILPKLQEYASCIDYFLFDISYIEQDAVQYDFEALKKVSELGFPFFVSGLASLDLLPQIIEKFSPFAFDVDTCIERLPKRKDYDKVSLAIKSAHGLRI